MPDWWVLQFIEQYPYIGVAIVFILCGVGLPLPEEIALITAGYLCYLAKNDPELTVSYSVDPPGLSGDAMRLPQVSRRMTREEVLLARGTADALALNRRYHNEATHARYSPPGDMARDLYEAMETARCEAMGARDMPGTAGNIDAKISHEALRRGYAFRPQWCDWRVHGADSSGREALVRLGVRMFDAPG